MEFLRRWRGKKIMFVGDSLSLNMFQSLSCMIYASVPSAKYNSVMSIESVTFPVSSISPVLLFIYYQINFI